MKRYILMSFVLLIASTTVAQEVYKDEYFELNTSHNQNKSYHYIALDSINLGHGFYYAANANNNLELETDNLLLISPTYGSDDLHPSDISIGSGMPYTLPTITDVNDNGAATIAIPIESPQGINGLQPELSFVYNSQAGDGIMGVGWSVGGMSKISRVPYTYHYSDHTNAVTFTNSDDYSLDGNRLLKGTDGMYYPEVFDNSIIGYSESSGFVVRKPNGYIYRYGTTDESRYYINGISKPIEWHLEEIEDTYGNKINFYYHNDVDEGSFYPEKIVYGGNVKYTIEFQYNYGNRNNTQKKYFSTSSSSGFSKITKLLSDISFYYGDDESWFQKYILLYDSSNELSNNRLLSIEKYGSTNETRSTNKYCNSQFVWNSNERTLQKDITTNKPYTGKSYNDNGQMWNQSKVLPVKFNHTSSYNLTDIVHLIRNEVMPYYHMKSYLNQSIYNNHSDKFSYIFNNSPNVDAVNNFLADKKDIVLFAPIDFDGDGYNEILCINRKNNINYINMFCYIKAGNRFTIVTDIIPQIPNSNAYSYEFHVGDYDGNGCSDLFATNGNNIIMALSIDGAFNYRKTKSVQLYYNNMNHEFIVGDFNGDGRDQILCLRENTSNNNSDVFLIKVNKNQNDYTITNNEITDNEFAKYRFGTNEYSKCTHLCSGDFNGDNKQDLLVVMNKSNDHNWYFYLSKGNGKFSEKIKSEAELSYFDICNDIIPVMADFNDDGFTDLEVLYKDFDTVYNSQYNYTLYDAYYRYEYLIRVDDTIGKVFRKSIMCNNAEQPIEMVQTNNTSIWRENPILSCTGNFRGTSPNERMYVKLCYEDSMTRGNIYAQLINVGYFDSIQHNVINRVINGLGVATEFNYTQHTYQGQWIDDLRTTASDLTPQVRTHSGHLLVVNELRKETNQGVYKTTKYFYSNPVFHTRGKGFLGFNNVSKTESTQQSNIKIVTSKQFSLDSNYFVFYPQNIKVYTSSGTVENPSFGDISETIFTYESKKLGAYTYMPDKVFYPFQKEVFVKNKYKSSCIRTTINQIDAYGNPTQITQKYGYSENNMPYSEYNTISYVNKTSPKRIIGLVGTKTDVCHNHNTSIPVSYTEQYQYNNNGSLIYSNVKGIETTFTRDSFGNIISTIELSGDITKTKNTTYSSDGRLPIITSNSLNHTTSYTYINDKALLKSITDPNGLVTVYNYDILDNISSIEYPDGTKEEFVRKWVGTNWHNSNSDHPDVPEGDDAVYYTWSKKNGQNEITTFYDQHERKIRTVVKDIENNKIYTDYIYYDISGLLWKESLPYYKSKGETPQYVIYEYDINNRIKKITRPNGAVLTNNYSGNSLTTINFDGQKKTITYMPAGKPLKIKDNETTEIVYEYYGDGNIKSTVINGIENTRINYAYDSNGFPAFIDDPSLGKRTYLYNAFGELLSETNADSLTTTYTYDLLGRMTGRTDNDGSTTWHYDQQKKGLLDYSSHVTTDSDSPNVTERYIYDELGRIIEHRQLLGLGYEGHTLSMYYDYNDYGLQNSITYPTGFSLSYNYDYNGFVTSIENKITNEILWKINETDRFGNTSNFMLGDKIEVINTYNKITGLLECQKAINYSNTFHGSIQNTFYQWDIYGNLKSRKMKNIQEDFQYDNFNRLTKITIDSTFTRQTAFDAKGNIMNKSGIGYMHYGGENPYSVTKISDVTDESLIENNQNVTYTSFDKVSSVTQGSKKLEIYYGADRQRVYQDMTYGSMMIKNTTKRFFTNLYEEIGMGDNAKKIHYLTSPSGLFAIFVTHNDNSAMSYVLKDHIGSLYATITDGEVEYYSFDAWGRERNHNTLQYDNISTTFDRGFCMHEHYRDFGLINMNGRMYDPLVGRMLSPDIVIQNPEYSQSYNRYSYCFNNPLRFTDPSGYVVRNIWPPDDFSLGIDPYISLFDKENDITSSSYSLDESTGNDLWNVKRKTTYYFDVKDPNSISVNDEKHGKCVYLSLGEASKSLNKWDDNAKQWAQKNNDYYNSTGNQGYMTNNIIDYIIWNNIEKSYTDYNAQNINYKQIIDAYYRGSKIIVTMIFNGLYDDVVSSKGHAALLKSFTIWPNREVEFKFADPSPKRLLYDHKTSIDNFILPKYIESMQFIEFNLKSK